MSEIISENEHATYAHLDEDTRRELARVYGFAEIVEVNTDDAPEGLRD